MSSELQDVKPYVTRADWVMCANMQKAPIGKKLLLINPGGVLVIGTLTDTTREDYLEWSELPKRDKRKA